MKRLKVLLSAYACRPGMGSEPGVGWNVSRELAKYHQVWVLTRGNNRPTIEAEIHQNPIPNLQIIYCDFPDWAMAWKKGNRGVYLHYYLWQILAYFTAKKIHAQENFDLVHHVTYVRYSSPSFLSLLPIPFIWGPVGGGESTPQSFREEFSLKNHIYEFLRSLTHKAGEFDPFTRLTAHRSVLAWGTTNDTAKRLTAIGAKRVEVLSQLGLSSEELAQLSQYKNSDPQQKLRFISVGRLLHWKGFHLGLRAFALANFPNEIEYWIVGDGSERERLQALAKALKIDHQVKFCNELPRPETFKTIGQSLALIHPSLHESGGMVCLEAMAAGCPVICLDLGGPALQVTPETGFKIPAQDPEQTVNELAEIMIRLSGDPQLRNTLGESAQKRALEEFSWDKKGKCLALNYEEIYNY